MHRRGDLAAVVQQAGDLELVAVLLAHAERGQRAHLRARRRLGQQVGQHRHALAVAAGVGRLLVNGGVDQLDQRLEQVLQLGDQDAVVERDGRLRGQRFHQLLLGVAEGVHGAGGVARVDQLQHADHAAVVVLHRHGEEGLRAVAGLGVEGARAGEIVALGRVGVGHVHRLAGQRRVRHHHAVVGAALVVVHRQRREVDRRAAAAAHHIAQRMVAQHLEHQRVALHPVQGAAVGVGEFARGLQDAFEQGGQVALVRQRRADGVEGFEAAEDLLFAGHGGVGAGVSATK